MFWFSSSRGGGFVARLAPWVPSPPSVVRVALEAAWANKCDVLYDLGCGDGRVLVIAARDFGVRKAVGFEVDGLLVEAARIYAREYGVEDRVVVFERDLFEADLREATLVYLYLFQSINEKLKPKLEKELRPGARVVTLDFPVPGWVPVRVVRKVDEAGRIRTIRVYVVGISDTRYTVRGTKSDDWSAVRAWMEDC